MTTINESHARYIKKEYNVCPLIVPDLLKEDWLRQLLAVQERIPGEIVNILYVGALFGGRIDSFLRAFSKLKNAAKVSAIVLGDGPDRARYRAQYESRDILFPGYVTRKQLLTHLENADICYSDVWHEIGTPYKILEYMAAGRAVVAHDTRSLRETITHGVDGLLCAQDDSSIEEALTQLADDTELRNLLGKAARRRILDLHQGDRLHGLAERYAQLAAARK